MTNLPKRLSQNLMIKNHLNSMPNLNSLRKLIEDAGFTLIAFNKYNNPDEISKIVNMLHLEEEINTKNSFIYVKDKLKFVFLNNDLKDLDKIILLCHELGHIYDKNLNTSNYLSSRIEHENFANEFAHYLIHPTLFIKFISTFLKHKLACILSLILILASATGIYIFHNFSVIQAFLPNRANTEYYVTPSGEKYHKDFCKHVKYKTTSSQITITEAISKGYKPCLDCIGE